LFDKGAGGRLLSGRLVRTLNKEDNTQAALRSVGKRTGEALRNLPSPSSPELLSLPDWPVVDTSACVSTAHKMHANRRTEIDEPNCQKVELRPPTSTHRLRGWTRGNRQTEGTFSLSRPPVHPNLQCITQKRERGGEKTLSTIEVLRFGVDAWTRSFKTVRRSADKVRPPKISPGGRAGRVSGDLT